MDKYDGRPRRKVTNTRAHFFPKACCTTFRSGLLSILRCISFIRHLCCEWPRKMNTTVPTTENMNILFMGEFQNSTSPNLTSSQVFHVSRGFTGAGAVVCCSAFVVAEL